MESRDIVGLGPFGWLGDYPNSLSQALERHKYGVYLWAIRYQDQYLVHYAGKAMQRTFEVRLKEEDGYYYDSYSRIYDGARFAQGECVLRWEGNWYRKKDPRYTPKFQEFKAHEARLAPARTDMLQALHFLLLPISDQRVDRGPGLDRLAERIEATIWDKLKDAGGLAQSFRATRIKMFRRRANDPPAQVTLHLPVPVLGLENPCRLEV